MQLKKGFFFESIGKMVIYFIYMLQHFISCLKKNYRTIARTILEVYLKMQFRLYAVSLISLLRELFHKIGFYIIEMRHQKRHQINLQ